MTTLCILGPERTGRATPQKRSDTWQSATKSRLRANQEAVGVARVGGLSTTNASVAASNALLDRGYGKPVAPIEMDHHVNEFDGMTEEELAEYIGEQMSKLGIKIEES
jgi:hypothetical protein